MTRRTRRSLLSSLAELHRCRSGLAATEFALLAPILLLLFFGVVEGSDALSKSRRVSLAANTLADLTAQEEFILENDIDDLFNGVEQIIDASGDPMTIRVVSVVADKDGEPVVHWSRDNKGKTPYAKNTPYNNLPNKALLDVNASLIVGEITYPYQSKLTHHFISSITFDKLATRWPRRTKRVQLCSSPGVCTS